MAITLDLSQITVYSGIRPFLWPINRIQSSRKLTRLPKLWWQLHLLHRSLRLIRSNQNRIQARLQPSWQFSFSWSLSPLPSTSSHKNRNRLPISAPKQPDQEPVLERLNMIMEWIHALRNEFAQVNVETQETNELNSAWGMERTHGMVAACVQKAAADLMRIHVRILLVVHGDLLLRRRSPQLLLFRSNQRLHQPQLQHRPPSARGLKYTKEALW